MVGLDAPPWAIVTVLSIVGLCTGFFLNLCIQWFPRFDELKDQLIAAATRPTVCSRCFATPRNIEFIPVIGWILAGGRCLNCNSRRPATWPIIEIVTAALFVFFYLLEVPIGAQARLSESIFITAEGPQGPEALDLWPPVVWLHARYALHMLMICGLIAATEIDRRLRIIPDGCTVPVMLCAAITATVFGQLYIVPVWFQDASVMRQLQPAMPTFLQPLFVPFDGVSIARAHPHLHGLAVSLAGAAVGAGSVAAVRTVGGFVLKQEAMGMGDVILMAMIGSVIGWQPVLVVFILAPMLAIFAAVANWVLHQDKHIPYGPFLSLATVLLLATWRSSWPFAKRFFDMGPFFILMLIFMLLLLAVSLQLIQFVKRLCGWQDTLPEESEWPPADQLLYLSQEVPDEQTGQWPIEQWSGARAGRGLQQFHRWRHSDRR